MHLTNLSSWAASVELNRGPLKTVSVRLGPALLEPLSQLEERLSATRPIGRALLLRRVIAEGIKAMAAELDQSDS